MPDANLRILASAADLRRHRQRWDRLWNVSPSTSALLQADLLALELEHFHAGKRARLIVVERDGEFVAGLPLVERGGAPGWRIGALSGNCWSPTADLLLDPAADAGETLRRMLLGLRTTGWPIVDLHAFDPELSRWRQWRETLERRGVDHRRRDRFSIPLVRVAGDWQSYVASLSRNHRRQMHRKEKLADRDGGVELRLLREFSPSEIEPWLKRGFEVEDRNWKGDGGTSVLRSPGMFEFLVRQAHALAARGQLQLTFLEQRGMPIAFEYGWVSKGTYFCFKVGYDAAFADLSPSQLLRWRLFERLFVEQTCHTIDFCGPATRAITSWSNDRYLLQRMLVAPGRYSGRMALAAYAKLSPLFKRRMNTEAAQAASSATAEMPEELATVEA